MRRRVMFSVVGIGLVVAIVTILWGILDGPPVRFVLRYGLAPAGGPTGRVVLIEGIEFLEFEPGYCRVGTHEGCDRGDFVGRVSAWFGLSWGRTPSHSGYDCPPRWVEVPHRFLISRERITSGEFWRIRRPERRVLGDLQLEKTCFRRVAEDYCEQLAGRARRGVRLPDRLELEFVRGHLGLPAKLKRWERWARIRYSDEWYRDRGRGKFVSRQYAFRVVSTDPPRLKE